MRDHHTKTPKKALTILITLLLSGVAAAQTPEAPAPKAATVVGVPTLRVCTGPAGNNYNRVGQALKERLAGMVAVEVVETKGSWENLEGILGEPRRCDAIIAQEDAWALHQFEQPDQAHTIDRTATLYPEHVHLLCNNRVHADAISALDPDAHQILVSGYGSGSYITWKLFGTLNPAHARIPVVEMGIDESLLRLIEARKPECMFFVSGLGGRTLSTANEKFGDKLRLISVIDRKLHRPVGRDKRQIYAPSTITAKTYPGLLKDDLATQTVDAVFFTSPEWKAAHTIQATKLAAVLVELVAELGETLR